MRHRVAHRKLGRVTEHRISMLRNQATALLRHEHLTTTVARAKELRPFVERMLFDTLAPRFAERPGGYTRLLRLGFRRGDAAEIAQVELVGSEFNPRAKAETESKAEGAKPKAKGVGGRLRAAADRLRGKKSGGDEGDAKVEEKAEK